MIELSQKIEIREILRNSEDVKNAFIRRGYQILCTPYDGYYCIIATICNDNNEQITYEFKTKTEENCYIKAAQFLYTIQLLREEFGLEIN